ncbi:MAG: hypothetical protein ACJ74Q_11155 [Pyrinomonadaceae bacterium]
MTLLSPPSFDEKRAIVEILTALEYEKRKEETDVLDAVFRDYGLARAGKDKLAGLIRNSPGFERFFLSILRQVRPFSLMLAEVYEFLNARARTTTRRSSKFLISSDAASAKLEFDLSNFPKELVRFIGEAEMFGLLVELRFEGIDLEGPAQRWHETQAGSDWAAVSPRWDNDFYDDGFFRTLSYANTIIGEGPAAHRERAEAVARPILDRLAAIRDFVNGLPTPRGRSGYDFNVEYMTGGRGQRLTSDTAPARFHRVRPARASEFLAHSTRNRWDSSERTVLEELRNDMATFGAAINFYEDHSLRRSDLEWVAKRLGLAPSDVTADEYLHLLESLADDYRTRLDRVAPVVGDYSYLRTIERFIEFLSLPFWKNRWFLYELWTLVSVLDVASRVTEVELKNIAEGPGGALEWELPGGSARAPVATIGNGPHPINCWSQRKTYHPGTKAGLEPDLRLTKSAPDFHDILIVENKDRLTARGGYLSEILDRYVGGTCADSVWLVNYEQFSPGDAARLASRWPGRRVEIVSNFRPQQVPPEFEEDVENILRRYLPPPAEPPLEESPVPTPDSAAGAATELAPFEVTLLWKGPPRDLDLHAWIKNGDEVRHVSYADKGHLDAPPYAELDNDHTQGDGQETLRVGRGAHESVTLAVHNYSGETALSASNAVLRLNAGGRQLLLRVPRGGGGRWWHAIRLSDTDVEVLQELGDSPPTTSP